MITWFTIFGNNFASKISRLKVNKAILGTALKVRELILNSIWRTAELKQFSVTGQTQGEQRLIRLGQQSNKG